MPIVNINCGAGVQSSALVVLACQGKLHATSGTFANVGDDSEHPATLRFFRDFLQPYAERHGFPLHELHYATAGGTRETLMGRMMAEGSKRLPIPVYGSNAGKPNKRSCTADFKTRVIGKWLRAQGASRKNPATVMIGISVDEIERAGRGNQQAWEVREYPLLAMGLHRRDCQQIITSAGLPPAPKSSCYFCPFHSKQTWRELRRDTPDLFARAQKLEDTINAGRVERGLTPVYLTKTGRRLSDAVTVAQDQLWIEDDTAGIGEDGCDEGLCFV